MDIDVRPTRRESFLRKVGPHKRTSETIWVDVPAQPGVGAHRNALADTACGKRVNATLVTMLDDRVRCPDCSALLSKMEE